MATNFFMVLVIVTSLSKIAVNVALANLSDISISDELKLQLSGFMIYFDNQRTVIILVSFTNACVKRLSK